MTEYEPATGSYRDQIPGEIFKVARAVAEERRKTAPRSSPTVLVEDVVVALHQHHFIDAWAINRGPEFTSVVEEDITEFEAGVHEMFSEGWKLHGPVMHVNGQWVQFIVRGRVLADGRD